MVAGVLAAALPPTFAISGDGATILLGLADVGEARARYASTSVPGSRAWTQQGPALQATGGVSPGFGSAVALSRDGNTAVVTADGDSSPTTAPLHFGSVWTFTRSGSTWTPQGGKLYVPGHPGVRPSRSHSPATRRGWSSSAYDYFARGNGGWCFQRSAGAWGAEGRGSRRLPGTL